MCHTGILAFDDELLVGCIEPSVLYDEPWVDRIEASFLGIEILVALTSPAISMGGIRYRFHAVDVRGGDDRGHPSPPDPPYPFCARLTGPSFWFLPLSCHPILPPLQLTGPPMLE